jgi:methionyl-tRNA formyltransferase
LVLSGVRIVFAGTPEPALPSLAALIESHHEVVAVITRPDARSGRGRSLNMSPVAELATEHAIPLLRPESARDPEFAAQLAALEPDACPVVAYGALLPQPILDIPKYGWINLHFSLLPSWRGAAPVQHSIWHGDDITGATTFQLDAGMDTGPVFGTVTAAITRTTTAGSLLQELSESGANLLRQTIDGLESGLLNAQSQPSDGVSLAPKISVDDARIDWSHPALAVDRMIRACTPGPGAWTTWGDERVKVGPVVIATAELSETLDPGELLVTKKSVFVGTASEPVELGLVKPPGKREMAAGDWARGARLASGDLFS